MRSMTSTYCGVNSMRPTSVPRSGMNTCRRITWSRRMRTAPGTLMSLPSPCMVMLALPTMLVAYTLLSATLYTNASADTSCLPPVAAVWRPPMSATAFLEPHEPMTSGAAMSIILMMCVVLILL